MIFNKRYFSLFLLLFFVEAAIAFFLKDGFIRHTFGDFLVVILLYCFFKSFIRARPIPTSIVVLLIAFGIEFLQLTNILAYFNLEHSKTAKLVFGSTFHVSDLIAYTLGIITVLSIENNISK